MFIRIMFKNRIPNTNTLTIFTKLSCKEKQYLFVLILTNKKNSLLNELRILFQKKKIFSVCKINVSINCVHNTKVYKTEKNDVSTIKIFIFIKKVIICVQFTMPGK